MATPSNTSYMVECHDRWIESQGKPAVDNIKGLLAQISLAKWFLAFIAGGQFLTLIVMIAALARS